MDNTGPFWPSVIGIYSSGLRDTVVLGSLKLRLVRYSFYKTFLSQL